MPPRQSKPILAFLWRANEIDDSVVRMARETSTCAIFHIPTLQTEVANALKASGATDIQVSAESLMDPSCRDFLHASRVKTLWVEYHPALATCTLHGLLERMKEISALFSCIPVSGDLGFITRMVGLQWHPPVIAIKGFEASGFVSTETTGVLYSTLRETGSPGLQGTEWIIWGGVATPDAAAAFLCTGARGIVFESLHWQTDLVSADPSVIQRLSGLRPEHTALVGCNVGVPCRFFDKGNSMGVRELNQYENSLSQNEITEKERRAFAQKVEKTAVPALESDLSRQGLAFLGPEAAFAQSFAQRFGSSTRKAFQGFSDEILRLCREAPEKLCGMVDHSAAKALGTQYPFIQGAMTWISDIPEFALAVAEAGGLPTIALGLKGSAELEREFGHLKDVMGEKPYAVNFVALPENPNLEEQLAWIEQHRPPFAVIAAGEPSHAARLQELGIRTIYLASGEGLIRMALEAGVDFVVLEGNEAGGHVGEHSTLTLAQIGSELRRREPALFRDVHVILAGGIFNRETVFRAFMMGADAVQMGTAYLATREIVATGALSPLYQRLIVDSGPGMTAVSGENIGLRVRSLKTPKMDAICTLEREWASGPHDEISFRHRLETLSANSLLIAARSIPNPGDDLMDEESCLREGQFMSGAISGAVDTVHSLSEFHRALADGPLELTLPGRKEEHTPAAPARRPSRKDFERVAITGMALVNSLGNNPQDIWNSCLAMESGITEVPRSRWDHSLYYDPDPRVRGKTYCKVGAFQNLRISRKELGIAPQDFHSMADSTKLTLWLAHHVIRQSDILHSDIPRERIAVIISQNSGETAATIQDLVLDVYCHEIIQSLQDVIPMTPDLARVVAEKIKSGRLTVDDTTLLGRLNCAAAGFLCNRYGFQGPSYSVSAACATSLVALHSAIQLIRNDIVDAALVGGGEEFLHPSHYVEFSALKALAGLSDTARPVRESSRPFDATRDGMVLGEGGGMIVVERESLANQRGATIQAYITGLGASNNDRGMVEPLAETQEIAIGASFRDTNYGPEDVDLVECHATSTIQGDTEEVRALGNLFSRPNGTMLTSFKSQVGHTLGASGINSLVRGVMAMQMGTIPPTLNYRTPDPEMDLERKGWHVPIEPVDWPRPSGRPRRVQVNAFGFGGANYVVQLEECRNGSADVLVSAPSPQTTKPPEPEGREPDASIQGVSLFTTYMAGRPYRLGVVAPSEREAREKVEACTSAASGAPFSERSLRAMARQEIFAAPTEEPTRSLAFVFTGQGSQYAGMSKELYGSFPEIRKWMDKIADVADFDLLDLLFHSQEEDLQKTRWQQPALYTMEFAMAQHLISMGAAPRAMAGHSLGELVALSISGVFSYEDGFRIVNKRAQCMDKVAGLRGDPGTMIAVDAPMEYLKEKIAAYDNVYFTNFNSPHQIVIGGDTKPVLELMEAIKDDEYRATQLKVSMAFHSPIMKVIHKEMAAFVGTIPFHPPKIPVVSNTTMESFPDHPDRSREILMAHLESPVHWMQNVQTLWGDFGVRIFVEIGPRDTLCNLVEDTLEKGLCFPTCMPEEEARVYRSRIAHLYSLGHLHVDGIPIQKSTEPRRAPSPPQTTAPSREQDQVAAIVQREINAFILDFAGAKLSPRIVEAVRRELDPRFTHADLDRTLEGLRGPAHQGEQSEKTEARLSPPRREAVDTTVPSPLAEGIDYVEEVIQIIMKATGYERDEIEPEMDMRQDLAIRSSRLPVIMDDVERQFGITVNIEDFVGLRTVREIAEAIERLAVHPANELPAGLNADEVPTPQETAGSDKSVSEEVGPEGVIQRLVLEETTIPSAPFQPLALQSGQQVAVLRMGAGSGVSANLSPFLEEHFRVHLLHLDCLDGRKDGSFDLRTAKGAQHAASVLEKAESLAGLVAVLEGKSILSGTEEIPDFLTGFFSCLQSFMSSKSRKFCLCLHRDVPPQTVEAVLGEGILGMFLAAAQEYPSVLFRSVALDSRTDLKKAMETVLDKGNPVIQWVYHGEDAFSFRASHKPLSAAGEPQLVISEGDVIVISGGAKGVTHRIARSLAPFRPHLVLLGRTELDPAAAYAALRKNADPAEKGGHPILKRLGLRGSNPENRGSFEDLAGLEIARNVSRLSALGLRVSYHCCDAADPGQVAKTLDQVAATYGKVDGIIHGAGLIRDGFMESMTPGDFKSVVEVKLLGAWNLYQASKDRGLRFFLALSSLAAIQGNVGQVNYCAANRSLSTFLYSLGASDDQLISKAVMLPPIEGTGMAQDPEVKALMKLKGMESAFVHADEFAQMFCRELFLGPPKDSWVILARTFPTVKGTLVEPTKPDADEMSLGEVRFQHKDLPMIDSVQKWDLTKGELVATRTFSQAHDLWLADHKPYLSLTHPLVSGIMAAETFMEAAHCLYPYLRALGVRRLRFEDILECPKDTKREARILCRRQKHESRELLCDVQITSAGVSPAGRVLDKWSVNYRGQVILGAETSVLPVWPEFTVREEEIETKPIGPGEMQERYEQRTGLRGRYRVLERIHGTGASVVKGEMVYREHQDMAGLEQVRYQYPPYLLEALMQILAFHEAIRREEEKMEECNLIPFGMEEMRFSRPARDGERFLLEARLGSRDEKGVTWDAHALDERGTPIIQISSMRMNRFKL